MQVTRRRASAWLVGAMVASLLPGPSFAESDECPKLLTEPDGETYAAMGQHDGKVTGLELGPVSGRLDITGRDGVKESFVIDGATEIYCYAEPKRWLSIDECIRQGLSVFVDSFIDRQCRVRAYRIFDGSRWPARSFPFPPVELTEDLVPLSQRPKQPQWD